MPKYSKPHGNLTVRYLNGGDFSDRIIMRPKDGAEVQR